jgi:hypothetical protein
MIILCEFGGLRRFGRAQAWAVEQWMSVNDPSGDFRWAIAALAFRSFAALEAFVQKQLVRLARNVMRRAWQGARFAADGADADSMVAAGGG